MAAKLLVLLACVALGSAGPPAKRETAPTSAPAVDWEKHAQDFQKTFKEGLEKLTSSPDSQALQKSLKEGTDDVLAQVSRLAQTVQEAMKDANGKAKETLQQVQASLDKSVADFRTAHPEVEHQADQLKQKLQSVVDNTAQEFQKLGKEFNSQAEEANKKLAPQLKAGFDDFVKQTQVLTKNIADAAAAGKQ